MTIQPKCNKGAENQTEGPKKEERTGSTKPEKGNDNKTRPRSN